MGLMLLRQFGRHYQVIRMSFSVNEVLNSYKVIILTFAIYGSKVKQAVLLFLWHQGLAAFHHGKGTDEPIFYRIIPKDIQRSLFFRGLAEER